MATLEEINEKMILINNPTDYEYVCRLYIDKKRDTASLYVRINDTYEVRFGFTDPYKIKSQEPKYNISAVLRELDKPVCDMDVELFCPDEDITELWQLSIEYPNNKDTVFLYPTGKSDKLVATSESVKIQDLLKKKPLQVETSNLRTFLSELGHKQ